MIIVLAACSTPGKVTVSKYCQAMKLNDKDTMAAMALEPKDLEFKSFEIDSVTEPVEKDLELPGLTEQLNKLNQEKQDQGDKAMDAQDALDELKDELESSRRSKGELKKKIEEAETAFAAEKQLYNDIVVKIAALQKQITRERDLIKMSTDRTEDLEMFTGKSFYQTVTVKMTLENDEVINYIFLLRRSDLVLENRTINGRLVITKIASAADFEKEMQAEGQQ
jgi:septal ring factor EnvC (AmiA/AmiB activator)